MKTLTESRRRCCGSCSPTTSSRTRRPGEIDREGARRATSRRWPTRSTSLEPWDARRDPWRRSTRSATAAGLNRRRRSQPVRAAVTGSNVSPPLPESLELLGREATVARLRACRRDEAGPASSLLRHHRRRPARPRRPWRPAKPLASDARRPPADRVEADPVRRAASAGDGRVLAASLRRRGPGGCADPHVIVEHYTDGTTFSGAWATFAANSVHLGELPGVCAHFVIDTDGTIYQLVNLHVRCRHAIGMNWTAIGIEHVGTSDQQILSNPADDARIAAAHGVAHGSLRHPSTERDRTRRDLDEPVPSRGVSAPGDARRTPTGNTPTCRSTGIVCAAWRIGRVCRSGRRRPGSTLTAESAERSVFRSRPFGRCIGILPPATMRPVRLLRSPDFRLLVLSNGLSSLGDELALVALDDQGLRAEQRLGHRGRRGPARRHHPARGVRAPRGIDRRPDRDDRDARARLGGAGGHRRGAGVRRARVAGRRPLVPPGLRRLGRVAGRVRHRPDAPSTRRTSPRRTRNMETVRYIGMVAGPLIAGGLAGALGADKGTRVALLLDAITFLVITSAAASLRSAGCPSPCPRADATKGEARRGFAFIRRDRVLLIGVAAVARRSCSRPWTTWPRCSSPTIPTLLNAGNWGYGALAAVWLLGMVVGAGAHRATPAPGTARARRAAGLDHGWRWRSRSPRCSRTSCSRSRCSPWAAWRTASRASRCAA